MIGKIRFENNFKVILPYQERWDKFYTEISNEEFSGQSPAGDWSVESEVFLKFLMGIIAFTVIIREMHS